MARRRGAPSTKPRGPWGGAAAWLSLGLLLAARASLACSVCFTPTEENRVAFIATTVFLTFLPLLIMGGVILWIREKVRAHHAAQRQAEPRPD